MSGENKNNNEILLTVENLKKYFPIQGGRGNAK